jgi:hypothetical protein
MASRSSRSPNPEAAADMAPPALPGDPESVRLADEAVRGANWKRWGTYLAERQWGTVREDYSEWGTCWEYFPHDHRAKPRLSLGEDGLLGYTDRQNRVCFALALWNGQDPILKERLFGLTGPEGNHGEDVKEVYYYLDATPTCSYAKGLYRYPQAAFPYTRLVDGEPQARQARPRVRDHRHRRVRRPRYFDVFVEYAKAAPEDVLIRITVANRGRTPRASTCCPQLWLRNTWAWGRSTGRLLAEGPHLAVRRRTLAPRAPVTGPLPLRGRDEARRVALHRERDERRTALRRAERDRRT